MKQKHRLGSSSIYESFSDISLLMLATFIFLMVTILITSRLAQEYEVPRLKKEIIELKNDLAMAELYRQRAADNLEQMAVSSGSGESQFDKIVESATFGRKDFDVFIKGLRDLPGEDLHLIIDASGSMHGLTSFLVPVLRVIVVRSGKKLSALTWFTDNEAETYQGTMGSMFDQLMTGAPFAGNRETIGKGFIVAQRSAPAPGAYLLIGDEPPTDTIYYSDIPSPVFTLPLGRNDPTTNTAYKKIAEKTHGKTLYLDFK
ncbi:MAG: hypothetical protein GXP10_02200 [Gammaproteobacteria bacterium]|nr:hypothetical protein [Gammaproteobacteria bacterium]